MITEASSSPTLLCGNEGQDEARHEAQHRDALEDVERRDEDLLGGAVPCGPVPVSQGEEQRERIGGETA
jgi:hypothetical protein